MRFFKLIVFLWIILSVNISCAAEFFKFTGGEADNIFLPKNKIKIVFDRKKIPEDAMTAMFNLYDYNNEVIMSKVVDLYMSDTADISLKQFGTFDIDVKFFDETDKRLAEEKSSIAKIRDVRLVKPNPESRFGIGAYYAVRFTSDKADKAAKIQSLLGAAWDRDELLWDLCEYKRGEWNFKELDKAVEVCHKYNIEILGLLDYWSKWAKKHTKEGVADFADYAQRLVKRYKPNGVLAKEKGWKDGYGIRYWEIWNEPATFWNGTAEGFAELYTAAEKAIKKEDPNAVVLLSSSGDVFNKTVVDQIGSKNIDGVTPHYYCPPKSPEEGELDKAMKKNVDWIRKHKIKGPIICSEFGWDSTGEQHSLKNQALYLVRAFVMGLSSGHDIMISYNFINDGDDKSKKEFGIVNREDLTPKAAFSSYAAMVYFLEGATSKSFFQPLPEIRCYVFSSNRFPAVAVLWSSGSSGSLKIENIDGLSLFDVMGNEITESLRKNNEIPLTSAPVYLTVKDKKNVSLFSDILNKGVVVGIAPVKMNILPLVGSLKELPPVRIKIQNNSKEKISGTITVKPPKGWVLKNKKSTFKGLSPKSSSIVSIYFKQMDEVSDNLYDIQATLKTLDGSKSKIEKKLNELVAEYGSPMINGDLNDWHNAKFVYLNDADQAVGIVPYMYWNISAKVATMWDDDYFYFCGKVVDNVFSQPQSGSLIWQGDSFQIAIDAANLKKDNDNKSHYLFGLAKTKNGEEAWKWKGGDKQEVPMPEIKFVFKKKFENIYIYEAAIPRSIMPELKLEKGTHFGFSFMINDNDGASGRLADGGGRKGWMEWTPGIGTGYNSKYFTEWTLW